MMAKVKVGNKIAIYADPLTKKEMEGIGEVVQIIRTRCVRIDGLEMEEMYLAVKFMADGESCADAHFHGHECRRTCFLEK